MIHDTLVEFLPPMTDRSLVFNFLFKDMLTVLKRLLYHIPLDSKNSAPSAAP